MPRTEQLTAFTAPSGEMFVYTTDMPLSDGGILYSPDGTTYYALASKGFGGTRTEHDLSFYNPHSNTGGTLHRSESVITYGGETYVKQENFQLNQSSVVPLPATRCTEYFCQTEDGTFVYVSADRFNYSDESLKLFVGNGMTMRQIPIDEVTPYRGTTYIDTPEGSFSSSSPSNAMRDPKLVSQWGAAKLITLSASDYNITETADGEVTITPR